ncbi:uncharacterized protein LOC114302803 [Camellia sinensis]|uniref:uncharacterized protein LOC114302803 n=1 Tax=Camellia sinensis TaxID=4442 RepID=UPI001036C8BE|nr:uncharacterized protein LOC114302803 [Camellia sinensis]
MTQITNYHRSIRGHVHRVYLLKGPCQPRNYNFPRRKIGQSSKRFNASWFAKFGGRLEYDIAKDAAFCLCCYLFKPVIGDQGGDKSFVVDGFSSWKKNERLQGHVGGVNSSHNQAWRKYQNENLRAVLSKDVPEHLKLTTPSIQKDILNAIAVETTNAIVRELGDGMFSIVFDKSWDASMEEQFIVSFSMWKVGDM